MSTFVSRNLEPETDLFQESQKHIVNCLRMEEKTRLSTPTYPKIRKNELSMSFRVLSSKETNPKLTSLVLLFLLQAILNTFDNLSTICEDDDVQIVDASF